MSMQPTYYEFFAGAGMVRAGLGRNWQCLLANDFDHKKAKSYRANWSGDEMVRDDIRNLSFDTMPRKPDMVWASFPCQDLSLAGGGAGLKGERSGTFWPFIDHMRELIADGRAPKIIALENVVGALTSNGGRDFTTLMKELDGLGYRVGAFVADAANFLPHSRPRIFVIGLREDIRQPEFCKEGPSMWHTKALIHAQANLSDRLRKRWLWWDMPVPRKRSKSFIDIVEMDPTGISWHSKTDTRLLLSMMSDINLAKVHTAQCAGVPMVGGVYKRTRYEQGIKVQRAEVRFDNIAGCLRTPAGGSSRQSVLYVHGDVIRSRLLSTREAARLMGLRDSYILPKSYNEGYHLMGDGVAVPVVRHIKNHIFEPILSVNAVAAETMDFQTA